MERKKTTVCKKGKAIDVYIVHLSREAEQTFKDSLDRYIETLQGDYRTEITGES